MPIPDDVIRDMSDAFLVEEGSGNTTFDSLRAALRAAEARGYKLIGREPTEAMIKARIVPKEPGSFDERLAEGLRASWDAAPGMDKP